MSETQVVNGAEASAPQFYNPDAVASDAMAAMVKFYSDAFDRLQREMADMMIRNSRITNEQGRQLAELRATLKKKEEEFSELVKGSEEWREIAGKLGAELAALNVERKAEEERKANAKLGNVLAGRKAARKRAVPSARG